MKKILGCLVLVMIWFTACEGPRGPAGRDGIDGEVTYWKVFDFTVTRKAWELIGKPDEIGSYYYYVFDVPELTRAIYDEGLIVCYYRFKDDFGDNVQAILPYTYYDIFVNKWEEEFPYSVQYSYDVTPGSIAFKVTFSDFYTADNEPPVTCNFRLHLIY